MGAKFGRYYPNSWFQIYNDQITALYVFETEDRVKEEPVYLTSQQPDLTERKISSTSYGLKAKYTLKTSLQGDGNQWAKTLLFYSLKI